MRISFRSVRRLAAATVIGLTVVGGAASTAHADTRPENFARPIPAAAYGNGCSVPGPNLLFDTSPPLVDPSPWAAPWVFFVNFRPACDMHDAGYDGGIVFHPLRGGVVDTRSMSRSAIDVMFLQDLFTICNTQIPGNAPVARTLCTSIAITYFSAVRAAGVWLFDADPAVFGTQMTGPRPND